MEGQEVTPQDNSVPPVAGNSVENPAELKARIEQLEKEKQGIFNDLKSEREKRQAYERAQVAAASTNSVNPPSSVDPAQVAELIVNSKLERERAVRWLAKQEKVDPDDVESAPVMTELQGVIQRYSLQNLPITSGVQTAYKLLLQEREAANKANQLKELNRENVITSQQTASSVSTPPVGSKVVKVSRDDIKKMNWREYQVMKEKAAKSGEQILVE